MLDNLDDDSQVEMSSRASPGPQEHRRLSDEVAEEDLRINGLQELGGEETLEQNKKRFSHYFRIANFAFFVGSILYLWQSTWNVIYACQWYGNGDEDDDDGSEDDDDTEDEPFWSFYKVLSMAAALMYVANALVDGRVAASEVRGKIGSGRFGDDPRWEIGVAVTFGVAALCDFLSEFIASDDDMWPSYAAGCAAVDIYLLNAILVLSGRRPRFTSIPEALMSSGDILFLIGSIIDVTISLVDNPRAPTSRYIELAWCSFSSSALWFIDSVLYILADHLSSDNEDYSSIGSESSDESHDELEIASSLIPGSSLDSVTLGEESDVSPAMHRRLRLSATLD